MMPLNPQSVTRPKGWHTSRTGLGLIGSSIYLALVAWYIAWDWGALPVTMADRATILGAVCSPLAFLWLVLGYFQQQDELRENTAALRAQEAQMALQAAQTGQLATAAERQASAAIEASRIAAAQLRRLEEAELEATKIKCVLGNIAAMSREVLNG